MRTSEIKLATFWLVAQCLNQLRHQQRAALSSSSKIKEFAMKLNKKEVDKT
jgi:hypothetical protein